MKILMINKFLYPNGGSETYIFKLGEYLEKQGHEVQFFGMEHKGRCVGNCVNAYTSDMDFHGGSKMAKVAIGVVFLFLSIGVYMIGIEQGVISFLLGLLACCSVVTVIEKNYEDRSQSAVFGTLAKYTMPIFLMHTLFAAPLRTVLFKLGIQNAIIHVVLGIAISFIGPMVAAIIMKKAKWLEFFLYPGKFINVK